MDSFLKDVYEGKLSPDSIDEDYYNNLADKLTKAAFEGLNTDNPVDGDSFTAEDGRNALKGFLDQNIYAFSGAKSLTVLEQYRALLTDEKGEIVSFAQFKAAVLSVDNLYNKTYLAAEYDSAIASAQMAQLWQGLQSFPMLQYRTTGGESVCPICGGMDNMILASDDPAWGTIYPPNHFGCRCTVIPAGGGDAATPRDDVKNIIKAAKVPPYFKRNVGVDKVIYSDNHPYFKNIPSGKESELDAVKNYGMRSGENIYATADLPDYTPLGSKGATNDWWAEMAGSQRGDIVVTGKDNLSVTLDNKFRIHVLEDNNDGRHRFLNLAPEIIKNPDEIWSNRIKGSLQQVYIKYYDKFPIVVAVDVEKQVTGVTMYEVQKGGKLNYDALKNMRKGVLKYKK